MKKRETSKYTCAVCFDDINKVYSSNRGYLCEGCNDFNMLDDTKSTKGEKNPVEGQNEPLRASSSPMPSYYSILPAFIRYDSSLTHLQKLLYAEITSLSNKNGFCHAGNAYFSDLYGNSDRTITRAIAMLMKQGYISAQTEKIGERFLRKIYINNDIKAGKIKGMAENNKKNNAVVEKNKTKNENRKTKMSTPPRQKCLYNNTSNNTTSIDIYTGDRKMDKNDFLELPSWLGSTPLSRIIKLYSLRYEELLGFDPQIKARSNKASKLIRALIVSHGEYEVGLMTLLHFNWQGINGDSNIILKKITEAGFPLMWIHNNANLYKAYILNKMGLDTEEKKVKELDKVLKKNYIDK